jgi:hypothetical protein
MKQSALRLLKVKSHPLHTSQTRSLRVFFLSRNCLTRTWSASLLRFLNHTLHTLARPEELHFTSDQPVPEASYLHNSQQTQQTKFHAVSGILTRDSWNRGAADIRLRPHGHWDLQLLENSLMYFFLGMLIICLHTHVNTFALSCVELCGRYHS